MPCTVRDLAPLQATSAGSGVTNGIGHLDDATAIGLFITSSAGGLLTGAVLQVSQFDPADPFPQPGAGQSSGWVTLSTAQQPVPITSSGVGLLVPVIAFRGLRLANLSSATVPADVVAYAVKQITV